MPLAPVALVCCSKPKDMTPVKCGTDILSP
jgi:hypothetical protein